MLSVQYMHALRPVSAFTVAKVGLEFLDFVHSRPRFGINSYKRNISKSWVVSISEKEIMPKKCIIPRMSTDLVGVHWDTSFGQKYSCFKGILVENLDIMLFNCLERTHSLKVSYKSKVSSWATEDNTGMR